MRSLYNYIINTGITDELSFINNLRVRVCNQSVLIASTFILLHLILILLFPTTKYELLFTFGWIIIFSSTYILNYYHRRNTASASLVVLSILLLGLIQHCYGPHTRLEPVYLSLVILGMFLLEKKYWFYIIQFAIGTYLINGIYYNYYGASLEHLLLESAVYEYFLFSVILTTMVIYKVLLENKKNYKLLELQNVKMKEQNEELIRFNYIISHDLKEPIRSMVALTGLLKKKFSEDESQKELSNEIIGLGKRLNNMINDIGEYQNLEKMKIKNETFSISQVIKNIESSLPTELKEKKYITETFGIDEINTSKTCVYIILKNLIENAIKYNNEVPEIEVDCRKVSDKYSLTVRDNGIGIPQKFHEEVFIMFKRLNKKNIAKGTGLGLSISKKTAQKHGADLTIVESIPDLGTTFRLLIPAGVKYSYSMPTEN